MIRETVEKTGVFFDDDTNTSAILDRAIYGEGIHNIAAVEKVAAGTEGDEQTDRMILKQALDAHARQIVENSSTTTAARSSAKCNLAMATSNSTRQQG